MGIEKLDIPAILVDLARERPVFHSEADFQHALAWQIHKANLGLQPRLEYPFDYPSSKACDIVLVHDGRVVMAIELKYFCQKLEREVHGELFRLKWNTAADGGRHAALKDVERMEEFLEKTQKAGNRTMQAAVIAITNDPTFWEGPKQDDGTDAEFNIHEGSTTAGTLNWAAKTSRKTKRLYGKIKLFGKYEMKWDEYSRVGSDEEYGRFRYLHIPVQSPKV